VNSPIRDKKINKKIKNYSAKKKKRKKKKEATRKKWVIK
jgi:hypothetical protein